MKARCYNKKNCNYNYYGGRGIKVCDEWLNSYKSFEKWAQENGYKKELTLDKINNNGNYEPQNCRWVNQRIQNINKRPNKKNQLGFVGIKLSNNKKTYYGSVKINNKDYYTGCSNNIVEAAIMRNNYIVDNNLDNELNDLSKYLDNYNMELRYEPK